jgi:hypothetical protein
MMSNASRPTRRKPRRDEAAYVMVRAKKSFYRLGQPPGARLLIETLPVNVASRLRTMSADRKIRLRVFMRRGSFRLIAAPRIVSSAG